MSTKYFRRVVRTSVLIILAGIQLICVKGIDGKECRLQGYLLSVLASWIILVMYLEVQCAQDYSEKGGKTYTPFYVLAD